MAKMTGICFIDINGSRIRSKPEAKFSPGGPIRESIMDVNGHNGQATTEIKPGEVKFTIPHGNDVDIVALQALDEVPVTFQTDSGQTYLIRAAGVTDAIELSGREIEVTMSGAPAELV